MKYQKFEKFILFPLIYILGLFALLSHDVILLCDAKQDITSITYKNIDSLTSGSSFVVVLFYSSGCMACVKAMPEFERATKFFHDDEDMIFGASDIREDQLMAVRFGVAAVPIIKYFPHGKTATQYNGRIVEDELKETFRSLSFESRLYKKMRDARGSSGKQWNTLTQANKSQVALITVHEIQSQILDPQKHVLLSLFTPECTVPCNIIEHVAKLFKNDENIRIVKMDITKEPVEVTKHFKVSSNPTLIWFPISDKEHGAKQDKLPITIPTLTDFINRNTGNNRKADGTLHKMAGRVAPIDDYIKKMINDITFGTNMKGVLDGLQKTIRNLPHNQKYTSYYTTILEEVNKGKELFDILETEQKFIAKKLAKKSISLKEREEWFKFSNIIRAFVEIAADNFDDNSSVTIEDNTRQTNEKPKVQPKSSTTVKSKRRSHDEL